MLSVSSSSIPRLGIRFFTAPPLNTPRPPRRGDLEVKDVGAIKYFLQNETFGHLGLVDNNKPYVVPLNYGLKWDENMKYPIFLFHGANTGRKLDLIKANPNVCFSVSRNNGFVYPKGDLSSTAGLKYQSVIAEGTVKLLPVSENADLFSIFFAQFHLQVKKFAAGILKRVQFFEMNTTQLCCKQIQ
jgi:nitroimidazol reductase NimA-like FMN-containing flavoprotein (pyridoxamine 5'-phosphate oxidase superfamily)